MSGYFPSVRPSLSYNAYVLWVAGVITTVPPRGTSTIHEIWINILLSLQISHSLLVYSVHRYSYHGFKAQFSTHLIWPDTCAATTYLLFYLGFVCLPEINSTWQQTILEFPHQSGGMGTSNKIICLCEYPVYLAIGPYPSQYPRELNA